MNFAVGNVWDWYDRGYALVFTSSGTVKRKGELVMGTGIARQVRERFPEAPSYFGRQVTRRGNFLAVWLDKGLISFPVKHYHWLKADLSLIERSAHALAYLLTREGILAAMVPPGVGNSGFTWEAVRRRLSILETVQQLTVVSYAPLPGVVY